MEMFLMVVALSLIGTAVSAILFAAAVHNAPPPPEAPAPSPIAPDPPRFFAGTPQLADSRMPIEALLLQIERHVRLEQAAAESFHDAPTIESLHSRTMSPLVH
jgi:hypothetical protein